MPSAVRVQGSGNDREGGGMAGSEHAEELLQIEEADAWFEYLEATRAQSKTPLRRGRAVGLGPPHPAAARRPHAPRAAPPRRRVDPAAARA